MPYDTLLWGEVGAKNGYTGTVGLGPAPITATGDTCVTRSGFGAPIMVGLGSLSDTKPAGCRVKGNRSYGTNYFIGPGAIDFAGQGFMRDLAVPWQEGESLTGECSSTNVNEGSIIALDMAYGGAHPYPQTVGGAVAAAGGGELWSVPFTLTSAADVTAFSGEAALDTATTDTGDQWLDTRATYYIIGTVPSISAATVGGILQVRALPQAWNGYVPGIPVNPLSAVTFNAAGPVSLAYEPIGPFPGSALPNVSMCATTAGAVTGGLLIVKN